MAIFSKIAAVAQTLGSTSGKVGRQQVFKWCAWVEGEGALSFFFKAATGCLKKRDRDEGTKKNKEKFIPSYLSGAPDLMNMNE